jgi:hypothetical protein
LPSSAEGWSRSQRSTEIGLRDGVVQSREVSSGSPALSTLLFERGAGAGLRAAADDPDRLRAVATRRTSAPAVDGPATCDQ